MRFFFTAALAAASVTGAASADSQRAIEIRFIEGDLNQPQRVAMLRERIEDAADRVCGVHARQPLSERRAALECSEEAEQRALNELERRVADAGGLIRVAVVAG